MRDPAHKIMRETAAPDKKENSFCSVVHWEIYADLLHHNSPKKLQLRQPKDGNGDWQQLATTRLVISAIILYAERRGSCKMISFSDVKLKAP